MLNRFKKRRSDKTRSYTYVSKNTARAEEVAVYRKLAIIAVLVISLAIALYLWGIPLVVQLGSFWGRIGGQPTPTIQLNEDPTIVIPRLDPIPSSVRNQSEVVISGTGPAGMDIAIYINNQREVTVLADASGKFEVKDLTLIEGENLIFAKTISNEAESEASNTQIVVFDRTPPKLVIIAPADGTTTAEDTIELTGNTEPQAVVVINNLQIIVNSTTGDFSRTFDLQPGENTFDILTRDRAGNDRQTSIMVIREGQDETTPTPVED